MVARMNGAMFLRSTSVALTTSFTGRGSLLILVIPQRPWHLGTPPDHYLYIRSRATTPPPVSLISLSLSRYLIVLPCAAPISLRLGLLRAS